MISLSLYRYFAARAAKMATVVLCACMSVGCGDERQKAIDKLGKMGIPLVPTSIHQQASLGREAEISLLVKAGVDAGQPDQTGALIHHTMAKKGSWPIVAALLPGLSAAVINAPCQSGELILQTALTAGQNGVAEQLLDHGASVTALPEQGAPVIEKAIAAGQLAFARRLIDGLRDGHEALPRAMMASVKAADAKLVAACLAAGAAADAQLPGQPLPLTLAAERKDAGMMKLLLESGASAGGVPVLARAAVEVGDVNFLSYVLDAGALPDAPAPDGSTALSAAVAGGRKDLAVCLMTRGANPAGLIDRALAEDAPTLLTFLLDNGMPPSAADGNGDPLIIRAVNAGRLNVVTMLLERGAELNALGAEGQTPFHLAVTNRDVPMVKFFMERGCDLNATFNAPVAPEFLQRVAHKYFEGWLKRDKGLTPVMMAGARGDLDMLEFLLANGGKKAQYTNGWKRYPVNFACETVNIKAAQMLLGRKRNEERNVRVEISIGKQRATLFKDGLAVRSSRVSTGKRGFATPKGKYVISDKEVSWVSTIYHSSMPYFMRLSCQAFGMHYGVCPGYPASHGCIRMPMGDVRSFFAVAKVGDPVDIVD